MSLMSNMFEELDQGVALFEIINVQENHLLPSFKIDTRVTKSEIKLKHSNKIFD